jgi:hypothetical protein
MKTSLISTTLLSLAVVVVSGSAQAQNGYFGNGYGQQYQGEVFMPHGSCISGTTGQDLGTGNCFDRNGRPLPGVFLRSDGVAVLGGQGSFQQSYRQPQSPGSYANYNSGPRCVDRQGRPTGCNFNGPQQFPANNGYPQQPQGYFGNNGYPPPNAQNGVTWLLGEAWDYCKMALAFRGQC